MLSCSRGRSFIPWLVVLTVLPAACPAAAQAPADDPARPRIGLVLGGGGARGMAHIGVIRTLEQLRIPIDCIAGTSMGALVGGLYASGADMAAVLSRLEATDWDSLFNDSPPRREKPWQAKKSDFDNLFGVELGMRGTSLVLPRGATAGYKFEFLLRELMARAGNFANIDFDELPIPFRAVATNIEDGTSRVFDAGDPVEAMRASMSVPGVIAPAELDGRLYVDGGLLDNIPVDAARSACADVVIVVNVGSPLLKREDLDSALGISLQMLNVLIEQNVRASLASLGPGDVLITPDLGDFSSTDFTNGLSLIPVGEAAAQAARGELLRHAVSEAEYRAWKNRVAARLPLIPPVREVRVATTEGRVNPEVIERELAEVPGIDLRRRPETDFALENLNRRLEQIYGRGDFERMDYRMIDGPDGRIVEVQGVEKSWGPNYLKFGLSLASDRDQTRFNLAAQQRRTWINRRGGEWRNALSIGFQNHFVSEYHQPLSLRAGAFAAARVEVQDEPIVYFVDGRRIGNYNVSHGRAHLDVGVENKFGQLRIGLFGGRLNADEDFGLLSLAPEFAINQVGYTASVVYDQIDDPNFPRSGWLASLESFGTDAGLGSEDEYNRTELKLVAAASRGRHGIQIAGLYGDTLVGDIPPYDPFRLGGFLNGSGYRMDELLGDRVVLGRIAYNYQLAALPQALGSGVYVGASLEGTNNRFSGVSDDNQSRASMSVFIGAETVLGPAFIAFGQAFGDDSPSGFYLMLGNP